MNELSAAAIILLAHADQVLLCLALIPATYFASFLVKRLRDNARTIKQMKGR